MRYNIPEVNFMNKTKTIQVFSTLPPEAQEQVASFVEFLREKYKKITRKFKNKGPISDDPFVGIWANRKDMKDSSDWVKILRKNEWQ